MTTIDFRYGLHLRTEPDELPVITDSSDRFIQWTKGAILFRDEESGDDEVELGRFAVCYVDANGAEEARESLFDVFDHDGSVSPYYKTLYASRGNLPFRAAVRMAVADDPWSASLLILDRLVIYPAYRGHGIGLAVLARLMHRYRGGAGVIAMKPFPLQFENQAWRKPDEVLSDEQRKLELKRFGTDEMKARKALMDYYGRLGFVRVRGTDMMAISAHAKLPEPEQFIRVPDSFE